MNLEYFIQVYRTRNKSGLFIEDILRKLLESEMRTSDLIILFFALLNGEKGILPSEMQDMIISERKKLGR